MIIPTIIVIMIAINSLAIIALTIKAVRLTKAQARLPHFTIAVAKSAELGSAGVQRVDIGKIMESVAAEKLRRNEVQGVGHRYETK